MANLNKHPSEPHPHDVDELLKIVKGTQIITSDDVHLGDALHLHQRLENVDRDLKLYEYYLECSRLEMGNNGYIPTEFINTIDQENQQITLSVPMSDFLAERWDVAPDFVAFSSGKKHDLSTN